MLPLWNTIYHHRNYSNHHYCQNCKTLATNITCIASLKVSTIDGSGGAESRPPILRIRPQRNTSAIQFGHSVRARTKCNEEGREDCKLGNNPIKKSTLCFAIIFTPSRVPLLSLLGDCERGFTIGPHSSLNSACRTSLFVPFKSTVVD